MGALAVLYSAAVWAEGSLYERYETVTFERARQSSLTNPSGVHDAIVAAVREGAPLARLEIPKVKLTVMVLEGNDAKALRLGAGHIPGTAWLGSPGNVGVAAHRDTFFRPLKHVRVGDEIVLTALDGVYRYRVQSLKVVTPQNVQVLEPTRGESLTLVTCYPFEFVGSAPYRFIIHADRADDERYRAYSKGSGNEENETASRQLRKESNL